jgi:hypothetical protein
MPRSEKEADFCHSGLRRRGKRGAGGAFPEPDICFEMCFEPAYQIYPLQGSAEEGFLLDRDLQQTNVTRRVAWRAKSGQAKLV